MDSDSQYHSDEDEDEEDPDDSGGRNYGITPIYTIPIVFFLIYIHRPVMESYFPLYIHAESDILLGVSLLSIMMEMACRFTATRNLRIAKTMMKTSILAVIFILVGMGSLSTYMQLNPLVPLLKIEESIDLTDDGWEEDDSHPNATKSYIRAAKPLTGYIFRGDGAGIRRTWILPTNEYGPPLSLEQLRIFGKEIGMHTITEEKCDEYKKCTLVGEVEGGRMSLYSPDNDHLEMILVSEKGGEPLTHRKR